MQLTEVLVLKFLSQYVVSREMSPEVSIVLERVLAEVWISEGLVWTCQWLCLSLLSHMQWRERSVAWTEGRNMDGISASEAIPLWSHRPLLADPNALTGFKPFILGSNIQSWSSTYCAFVFLWVSSTQLCARAAVGHHSRCQTLSPRSFGRTCYPIEKIKFLRALKLKPLEHSWNCYEVILSKNLRQCLDVASKGALKLLILAKLPLQCILEHSKRTLFLTQVTMQGTWNAWLTGNLLLKLEPGKSIASRQAMQLSSSEDLSENIFDTLRNCFSPPAIYHNQCGWGRKGGNVSFALLFCVKGKSYLKSFKSFQKGSPPLERLK